MAAEEPELQAGTTDEPGADNGRLTADGKEPDVEEMVSRITPENRHEEWDLGPPQGKEIW